MKIKSVEINNYKSFNEGCYINLQEGINLIVGKNDSGKSSLLNVLTFDFIPENHISILSKPDINYQINKKTIITTKIVFTKEEITAFMIRNSDKEIYFPSPQGFGDRDAKKRNIDLYFGKQEFNIEYVIENNRLISFNIDEFVNGFSTNSILLVRDFNNNIKADVRNNTGTVPNTLINLLFEELKSNIFYFHAERYNVGISKFGSDTKLKKDASNLPEVIDNLKSKRVVLDNYIKHVSEVFPEIKDITIKNRGSSDVEIMLWPIDPNISRDDLLINLNKSGSGIVQIMAILYVVLTSTDSKIIIIDEPQSFLHPGALKKLMNILNNYKQHQYILATHSHIIINSAKDASIISLEKEEYETKVKQIDKNNFSDIKKMLDNIGLSLSDLFGVDNIIWVEGPTEEKIFPSILENNISASTQISAVKNTGDFSGKNAQMIFSIYEKVSGSNRIIPPAVCFIFDNENKTKQNKDDIRRRAKDKKVYFLKRTMFENYIIDSDAITKILKKRYADFKFRVGIEINKDKVDEWIKLNFKVNKYYDKNISESINDYFYEDDRWQETINAAKFLTDLYKAFFDSLYVYSKLSDSIDIARWLLEKKSDKINILKNELLEAIKDLK